MAFLYKGTLLKELNLLPKGAHLTIDTSESTYIDYDLIEILGSFSKHASEREISVVYKNTRALETANY